MAGIEPHAPVLSVTANAHRQVKRGIIGNRRGVDLINEALFFQKLLNPGELRNCERTLQRVAAARIEKDDDRRTSVKKFFEGDPVTILILENSFVYLLSAMARIIRPGDLAQKT